MCEEIENHANFNKLTDLFKRNHTLSKALQIQHPPIRGEN